MRYTLTRLSRSWSPVLAGAALCGLAAAAGAPTVTCISVDPAGEVGDGVTTNLTITPNGRFALFQSDATNLVPGDTNGMRDVFLHDRRKGTLRRVSLAFDGQQGDAPSSNGGTSSNARWVVFHSDATNLVPDDTNGVRDIFVRDLRKGRVERVSLSSTGEQANLNCSWPAISANGRYVSFSSPATNLVPDDTNGSGDIFVFDRKRRRIERVSVGPDGDEADGGSGHVSISRTGRHVGFQSSASNLVPGDTNGLADLFVRDRRRRTTVRVSVGPGGEQADGISYGTSMDWRGRRVAFTSDATTLVAGDTNGARDSFVWDRKLGRCIRVSVSSSGEEGSSTSYHSHVSPDGRFVAISSHADNLVANDTNGWHDVFLHDVKKRTTVLVSISADGRQCDGDSWRPRPSKKGRYVLYYSLAPDVVPGDGNGLQDVFVWKR